MFKPAGMLTVGDKTGDRTLLQLARQYVREKYRKPGDVYLGVVHRLDRPVSGVVLFARTSKAAARLSEQFRTGRVQKLYLAWVEGAPTKPAGTMTDLLIKDEQRNVTRTAPADATDSRTAELAYRTLKRTAAASLLEIVPRTGRSHQIRVQLASRGLPIIGDVKYGARGAQAGQISLHATRLTFEHPTRHEPVSVHAEPPPEWDDLFVKG